MKKTALLLITWFCVQFAAQAQWVTKSAGFTKSSLTVFSLSVPNATTAWAIAIDNTSQSLSTEFTRTTNGGQTWQRGSLGNLLPNQQLTSIFAQDANTAWVTGMEISTAGFQGKVMKTTDGGVTWTQQSSASFSGPDSSPMGIHFFDANNGLVYGDPDGGRFEIYTTSNGGATWTLATNAPARNQNEYADFIYTAAGSSFWFTTDEGRIIHTADKGLTWTVQDPGLMHIESMAFQDAQNGLLMGDGEVYRTTDGGHNWTKIANTGTVYMQYITAVPGAPGTYVSAGGMTTNSGSSFTTDNGATWHELENNIVHTAVKFASAGAGFSGGVNAMHTFSGSLITGTTKELTAQQAVVYPNPGTGLFHLRAQNLAAEKATVSVLNMLGQEVLRLQPTELSAGETLSFDLSNQAKGMYLLQIETAGQRYQKRLILN